MTLLLYCYIFKENKESGWKVGNAWPKPPPALLPEPSCLIKGYMAAPDLEENRRPVSSLVQSGSVKFEFWSIYLPMLCSTSSYSSSCAQIHLNIQKIQNNYAGLFSAGFTLSRTKRKRLTRRPSISSTLTSHPGSLNVSFFSGTFCKTLSAIPAAVL